MSEKNKERKAHFLLIFVTHPGAFAICKRKQFGNLKVKVFTNFAHLPLNKTFFRKYAGLLIKQAIKKMLFFLTIPFDGLS